MRRVTLVRHASHDRLGRVLCGRMEGVSLSARGREEAHALAARLAGSRAERVLSSPQARARETASRIAETLGVAVETAAELDEIAFGAWTGRGFADLDGDPLWDAWNTSRGTSRPPGGESMAEAQARVGRLLDRLGCEVEGSDRGEWAPVVLVSHADVIRAAALRVLGLNLDAYDRIEIAPASLSEFALWPGGGRVVSLNERTAS